MPTIPYTTVYCPPMPFIYITVNRKGQSPMSRSPERKLRAAIVCSLLFVSSGHIGVEGEHLFLGVKEANVHLVGHGAG